MSPTKRSTYYFITPMLGERGDSMLILSRKEGESIQIGDGIEIKVISIQGEQVKIGIDAPRSVEVYRREIYLQIQEENRKAATVGSDLIGLIQKSQKK